VTKTGRHVSKIEGDGLTDGQTTRRSNTAVALRR